ncbi:hypothetical protein AYK26_03150 [Euryarchaeota archaeon SM23-78]|nr:MAG: hypothetical protein AYK26_03150 [Euryarchaeota archaeon SM23-78]MBW3000693.1 hypothetical protein [Candidatus Woesearchaeota archaeon]
MNELLTRCEKRFRFSKRELFQLIITVLVAAFVLSFRNWGVGEEFSFDEGLTNLLLTAIIVFIFLIIHFSVQKIVALKMGYKSEYRYWINGFLISLIVVFLTEGHFPLFFTGSLWHEVIPKLRVGVFRGGAKHKDIGIIAFSGPLINILLVGLLAPIYLATESSFLHSIIFVNLLIAIFSLLPLPTFEKLRQFKGGTTGLYLFIASRWVFVLVFVTTLAYTVLILLANVFSYIIALAIGIITTVVYYFVYESK